MKTIALVGSVIVSTLLLVGCASKDDSMNPGTDMNAGKATVAHHDYKGEVSKAK